MAARELLRTECMKLRSNDALKLAVLDDLDEVQIQCSNRLLVYIHTLHTPHYLCLFAVAVTF
jgi:hypothetical protein